MSRTMTSLLPLVLKRTILISQVIIYHGALDIICHYVGAQEMIATTNWTGKDEFHQSERKALWVYNEVLLTTFPKFVHHKGPSTTFGFLFLPGNNAERTCRLRQR